VEAEHLHIVLFFLALALVLGSKPAIFGFKSFSVRLYIYSLLLYSQLCHALSMFCHLTSMFIHHDACENCSLSFVFIHEGILPLTCPLPLSFL
jgi:hypothetical protein